MTKDQATMTNGTEVQKMVARQKTRPARRSTLAGVHQWASADGPALFEATCAVTARPMPGWCQRVLCWALRVLLGMRIEPRCGARLLPAQPPTIAMAYHRSTN